MTRVNPTNPADLPPPNLSDLRASLRAGEPLTCWRVGVIADPTMAQVYGLNGQPQRTGGAGWLHSSVRLCGSQVMLLVGNGQGREPGWRQVGTVVGTQVSWNGLSEPNQVQVMRARLACCLLRSLGFKVSEYSVDGTMLATDRVLVGATCQREGCHRPLTTPESIRTGYGPVCGGREKAPRSYASVNLADAMRARGKV